MTEHLARALDAPALLTRYSRLLIDPNRGSDDPTLIMQLSDGRVVPGNAYVGRRRGRGAHRGLLRALSPCHQREAIDAAVAAGKPPVVLAIHSFTQAWKSVPRPWHVAVLWDKDPRSLARCCTSLRRSQASPSATTCLAVLKGDTLYQHGTLRGLAHALIEVRQDLILGPEGQEEWGATGFGGADGARCRRSRTQLHVIELAPIPTARRRALDKLDKNYPRVAL